MRKILLFLVIVLVLAAGFIYLFIPTTVKLTTTTNIKCTINELNTCLRDTNKWHQWFPGNKDALIINGYKYSEKELKLNGADIEISNAKNKLNSTLLGLTLTPDSLLVTWSTEIRNDYDPIKRIKSYMQTSALRKDMQTILDSLKSFASHSINIYGFNIRRTSFEDSLLISSKKVYNSKPDLEEQYHVINNLKQYIISKGATITDSPMVNMSPDISGYRMQIAVAIDRAIPENDVYNLIRMVHINGNYVAADVLGSPEKIQEAHRQIEAFMKDHFLTSPGIPFEIYLTDRKKESDSNKWKTRIYYPST